MIPPLPHGFSHPVHIGAGGYGSVYRARQDTINRLVALKFITEKNASARTIVMKEASMQAELSIHGIPQIFDVKDFHGNVCIVMQWIKGCSLRNLIAMGLPIAYEHAIITEIIRITAALHQRDYVHRDIKPENIIISPDGVFLIDFGFSLNMHRDAQHIPVNSVKGTPEYIAPEVRKGEGNVMELKRADVYSMGKVILEVTGTDRFPDCISSCLQETPSKRPHSAIEVMQQWESTVHPTSAVTNWTEIVEPCSNDILAGQLYLSVQALLKAHRSEEAYNLLVECLQMNPEFPDALELMTRFPIITNNQTVLSRYTFAVIAGTVLLISLMSLVIFFAWTPAANKTALSPQTYDRSLFVSASRTAADKIDQSLPLKDEPDPLKKLNGKLVIVAHPHIGSLFIDGKPCAGSTDTIVLSSRTVDHGVAWRTGNGSVVWQEIIRIHPFEIKRVCIKER